MAKTSLTKPSKLDGRKMWFFFAAGAALVTAGVIFALLSSVASTSTYWVLKDGVNLQSREVITADMMQPVQAPSNAVPKNIVTISQIKAAEGGDEGDDFYALYPIKSGDILTTSNVGGMVAFGEGLTGDKNSVYASFKANPSLASGGNVQEGNMIDIAIIYEDGSGNFSSKFFLSNVLVVKTSIDLDSTAGVAQTTETGNTVQSSSVTSGTPVLYTVAVTPEQAAALAVANKYSIYVVLSSANKDKNSSSASLDTLLSGMYDASSTTEIVEEGAVEEIVEEDKPSTKQDETAAPENASTRE